MGLGESVVPEGDAGGGLAIEVASTCSICLEVVMTGGGRSTVILLCGHEFHLDCIGSAFNAKGMMQCPNCRNIEKGSWLHGNGYCCVQSLNMDEWTHDDELYDLNFMEMPYTIRWCPVNRIGRVIASFENGESFPSVALRDIGGHNIITELPSISVPARPCPHLSSFHQVQPASAPTFHASSDGTNDTSSYYNQWSQVSESTEVPSSLSLHSGDAHVRGRSTYSHPRDITTASIPAPVSQAAPRATRLEDGGPYRAGSLSYSVIGRHGSSHSLPMLPHLRSSNRAHAHAHELHRQANISADPWRSRSGNSSSPTRSHLSPSNHFGFYMYPLPVSFNSSLGDAVIDTGAHFRRSAAQFLPVTASQQLVSMESGNWSFSGRRNSTSVAQHGSIRAWPYI